MAINNLEKKCTYRVAKPTLKFPIEGKDPENYNLTKQRKEFAEKQVNAIAQYMKAFKDILAEAQQKPEIKSKLEAKRLKEMWLTINF